MHAILAMIVPAGFASTALMAVLVSAVAGGVVPLVLVALAFGLPTAVATRVLLYRFAWFAELYADRLEWQAVRRRGSFSIGALSHMAVGGRFMARITTRDGLSIKVLGGNGVLQLAEDIQRLSPQFEVRDRRTLERWSRRGESNYRRVS